MRISQKICTIIKKHNYYTSREKLVKKIHIKIVIRSKFVSQFIRLKAFVLKFLDQNPLFNFSNFCRLKPRLSQSNSFRFRESALENVWKALEMKSPTVAALSDAGQDRSSLMRGRIYAL